MAVAKTLLCGGAWLHLYERSLLIAFGVLFGSFVGHAVAGAHETGD